MMALKIVWIVMVAMALLSGGIDLEKHGQPKTGKHSFGSWLLSALLLSPIFYAAFRYIWG